MMVAPSGQHPAGTLRVLALLLACTAARADVWRYHNKYATGVEISNSVITFRVDDLGLYGAPNNCVAEVKRASVYGAKKLQMVFTHGARLDSTTLCPDAAPQSAPNGCRVTSYCYGSYYNHGGVPPHDKDQNGQCWDWTQEVLDQMAVAYATCFKAAVDAGFTTLTITPHLDDDGNGPLSKSRWRNYFVFDPLEKLGPSQQSYKEVMLVPIVKGLRNSINWNTEIWLSLQGEMGATIFAYPASWAKIVSWAQWAVGRGKIEVGVGFNHNKVMGGTPNPPKRGMRELLHSMDFIGISAYTPVPVAVVEADLQLTVQRFAAEVKDIIDIRRFQPRGPKWRRQFLFYAEYGFGGGNADGSSYALSLADVAGNPQWGVWGDYKTTTDPWLVPAYKAWIENTYAVTANWLKDGGGPDYYITGLFIWSVQSFNVMGVGYYPSLPGTDPPIPAYKNPVIEALVTKHNMEVNSRKYNNHHHHYWR